MFFLQDNTSNLIYTFEYTPNSKCHKKVTNNGLTISRFVMRPHPFFYWSIPARSIKIVVLYLEQTSSSLLGYRAILFQNVPLSSGFNLTQQRHKLCNSIGYFWRHRRWKWSGRSDNSFNFIIKTPVQTYQTRNGQNALLCRNTNVSKPIIDIY